MAGDLKKKSIFAKLGGQKFIVLLVVIVLFTFFFNSKSGF
jgi:hypothetical protein